MLQKILPTHILLARSPRVIVESLEEPEESVKELLERVTSVDTSETHIVDHPPDRGARPGPKLGVLYVSTSGGLILDLVILICLQFTRE